jgi:hypothetical protein
VRELSDLILASNGQLENAEGMSVWRELLY